MLSRRDILMAGAALSVAAGVQTESFAETLAPPTGVGKVQVAKFYLFDAVEDLKPVTDGVEMPFAHVTMKPGIYRVGDQAFDCTRSGLYRFKVADEPFFRNRIVGGADPYALLSAVSWNVVHGTVHEWYGNLQGISDHGRYVVWRMRCGFIGNLVAWLLPQYGYSVRQIGVISEPGNRNGFDDGHQVVEVHVDGKWIMFDMTNGCYWRNAAGDHLNTDEFIAHIADGGLMPRKIKLDGNQRRWDYEQAPLPDGTILDLGLYGELCIDGIETLDGWFRRIFYQIDEPAAA